MGIKNLNKFLRDKCPQVIKSMTTADIRGQRVAIDANNWMYVNMYFANINASREVDIRNGETVSRDVVVKNWLGLCLDFTSKWLEQKIVPIFVFDGKYPVEKTLYSN